MGTITTRRRKDGTEGHTAVIRIKRDGKIVHRETQTFDRVAAAKLWMKKRESELSEPGALDKAKQKAPTLAEVIRQYLKESRRDPGKTKRQVLATIGNSDLGQMTCSEIDSAAVVVYAQSLNVQPQTVGNYMAHLGSVARIARPAWGYPLDAQAVEDARMVLVKLGRVSKSRSRDRRPTLDELDRLLDHFQTQLLKGARAKLPMVDLVLFAMFSTRRQEEITRLTWVDLDAEHSEVWVRDMKHPGEKIGNDVRVSLPPPALAVILRQPAGQDRIFPFNGESISASFTRACKLLGISDLHFHDLRHEGVSRLFEMGQTIPQVAAVSGHRSWASLRRYTHLRHSGDKYAGWKWMPAVSAAPTVA